MHRARAVKRSALVLLACITCLACDERAPRTERFSLEMRALTPRGEAVDGVRFWGDGRELGTSDLRGALRVQLSGHDGQAVAISTACPSGYRIKTQSRRLVLRRLARSPVSAVSDFVLTTICEPLEQRAAIVVRARGPAVAGLPIRVAGETVGQTDLDGTAHILLKARPHSSVRVELDTSARPELRPRDPVQTFVLEDEDSILLVDQRFAPLPRKRRERTRPAPVPEIPPVPYRIGSR